MAGRLRYLGSGTTPPARWDEIEAREPHLTAKTVLETVCNAEKDSGLTIYSAVVGVGGAHVRSNLVKTAVPVPQSRRVVEVTDVANALKKASGALLGPESTALQLVPLEFVAGSGQPVLNPIGSPPASGGESEGDLHADRGARDCQATGERSEPLVEETGGWLRRRYETLME